MFATTRRTDACGIERSRDGCADAEPGGEARRIRARTVEALPAALAHLAEAIPAGAAAAYPPPAATRARADPESL